MAGFPNRSDTTITTSSTTTTRSAKNPFHMEGELQRVQAASKRKEPRSSTSSTTTTKSPRNNARLEQVLNKFEAAQRGKEQAEADSKAKEQASLTPRMVTTLGDLINPPTEQDLKKSEAASKGKKHASSTPADRQSSSSASLGEVGDHVQSLPFIDDDPKKWPTGLERFEQGRIPMLRNKKTLKPTHVIRLGTMKGQKTSSVRNYITTNVLRRKK